MKHLILLLVLVCIGCGKSADGGLSPCETKDWQAGRVIDVKYTEMDTYKFNTANGNCDSHGVE